MIDVGGTHVRIGVIESLEEVGTIWPHKIDLTHDFWADFRQITTTIYDSVSHREITAIGVALPGSLNDTKTELVRAHNLPEWIGIPLRDKLAAMFVTQAFLENDAVAAALGEFYYGQGQGQDFMLAIWGTDVGGAAVNHTPALVAEKIDYHQYLADIEQRCGGKAIALKYGKPAAELTDQEWAPIALDFLTSIKQVGLALGFKRIICAGGVAIKQRPRLEALAPNVFADDTISFQVTTLGTAQSFGLYGAAGLLRNRLLKA